MTCNSVVSVSLIKPLLGLSFLSGCALIAAPWVNLRWGVFVEKRTDLSRKHIWLTFYWRRALLANSVGVALIVPALVYTMGSGSLLFKTPAGQK